MYYYDSDMILTLFIADIQVAIEHLRQAINKTKLGIRYNLHPYPYCARGQHYIV